MKRFAIHLLAAVLAATGAAAAESPLPDTIDLETALSLAAQNNYAIRQARAYYTGTTGGVMTSEAGRLPTLSAIGNYQRVDDRLIAFPGGSPTSWQAGVQASETLYAGGAISSSIRSSRATRDAAVAGYSEAVQSALLTVRVNYYAVLLAREQVGVQEQSVQLLQEELNNAKARVKAGSGSPFDELRAEVALANGQPPLIRARNSYHVSAVDLMRSIGLPPDAAIADRVVGALNYEPHEISLEDALASANEHRPEIQRLQRMVDAAEAAVGTAKAGARPSVSVVGGYSVQKSQFSSGGSTLDGWTVGAQASWDIWDSHATKGRVVQARAAAQQARLDLDDGRLAIDADVRRSYASYRDAIELVNSSRRVVEQAEESLRLARSRFSAGAATQLDVLTAQVALTDARTNAAQALHDVTVAYAFLERSAALSPVPEAAQLEKK